MKRYILMVFLLCCMLALGGCKDKKKEFVKGDNELIHLTSTPKGGVETYEIYTMNIMIYVDGRVRIYASDFVRWFGNEEIPEVTFTISQEDVETIEQLIVSEDLYNLRENVGNKDNISGVVKHMTIYSANGTNTTGGISVSNRQFVRAYDRIEAIVREQLFLYADAIDEIQYEGYTIYSNRSVKLLDREGDILLDHEYINDVYSHSVEMEDEALYYTVIEFNKYGGEVLRDISFYATEEDMVLLTLHINEVFETNIGISTPISDNKLYIQQDSEEAANQLSEKIKSSFR